MFIPPKYKNENLSQVRDFLDQNSFGILVSRMEGRPWATHIPLELDLDENGKDILVGHIAKANPQWQHFNETEQVLCIFNGPHSYISSKWYKDEEVPTWNYIAVHVYGVLKILDEAAVLASLHKLVDKYEKGSKNPLSLNDLSKNTLRQIKGIVGFRISIDTIEAAYKLSQGREGDHAEIIRELKATGNASSIQIAACMRPKKE